MALLARPNRYIGSLLPTSNSATAGRRPLTPRTTTQVRLLKQLLDKRTGALLVLPHLEGSHPRVHSNRRFLSRYSVAPSYTLLCPGDLLNSLL